MGESTIFTFAAAGVPSTGTARGDRRGSDLKASELRANTEFHIVKSQNLVQHRDGHGMVVSEAIVSGLAAGVITLFIPLLAGN